MSLRLREIILAALFLQALAPAHLSLANAGDNEDWAEWSKAQIGTQPPPAVQNRVISRSGHFQLVGPMIGLSDRRDFLNTLVGAVALRYHFTEQQGWELIRLNFATSQLDSLAQEIVDRTGFHPNAQASHVQLSTSYVYSPIYGKIAWGSERVIYFDVYGSIGAGVRFASDRQVFGQLGIGMNHYLWNRSVALVPEYQLRVYGENRTGSSTVFESMFQAGVSWLF